MVPENIHTTTMEEILCRDLPQTPLDLSSVRLLFHLKTNPSPLRNFQFPPWRGYEYILEPQMRNFKVWKVTLKAQHISISLYDCIGHILFMIKGFCIHTVKYYCVIFAHENLPCLKKDTEILVNLISTLLTLEHIFFSTNTLLLWYLLLCEKYIFKFLTFSIIVFFIFIFCPSTAIKSCEIP